jgi:hypothetical protein
MNRLRPGAVLERGSKERQKTERAIFSAFGHQSMFRGGRSRYMSYVQGVTNRNEACEVQVRAELPPFWPRARHIF